MSIYKSAGLPMEESKVPERGWWFSSLPRTRQKAFIRGWCQNVVAENMMRLAINRSADPEQLMRREDWVDKYLTSSLRASKKARRYFKFYSEGKLYRNQKPSRTARRGGQSERCYCYGGTCAAIMMFVFVFAIASEGLHIQVSDTVRDCIGMMGISAGMLYAPLLGIGTFIDSMEEKKTKCLG